MRAGRLAVVILALVLGNKTPSVAADAITVQLKWVHQAQFAGFYVARDKGYYAAENLDVTLEPGGEKIDLVRALTHGDADVGVLSPEDIIIRRSQGVPLKAIAAIYRRSAVVYLAMPESGIVRPQDFAGKTIAAAGRQGSIRDFEFQLDAMLKRLAVDLKTVRKVPYDPSYKEFCSGAIDVTAAYATGGLIKIRQMGFNPNVIWPGDYRVRFYSDTLAVADRMIADQPDKLRRFLSATLKGWQTAIGDPAGTVDIVLKYAQVKDREMQTAMFDAMLPLVHTGEDTIGWMRPEDWHEMHRVLAEEGLIVDPVDPVAQLFTLRFLEDIRQGKAK